MNSCYKLKPANYKPGKYFETLNAFAVPCYVYKEGEEGEDYWIDFQNMCYHVLLTEKNGLIDGKQYWVITPMKPKGVKITEDNQKLVKWIVEFSSNKSDVDFEWDFENHKCIK